MRRGAGLLLAVAGAALLLVAGVGYTRGYIERGRAHARWEAIVAQGGAVTSARGSVGGLLQRQPARGAPIGRLVIPAVGIDEVVLQGVDEAQLEAGPGHVPETVLPGEAGNSVISAHRDRHFRALGRVALGDTVVTETLAGRRIWVVTKRRIADAGKPSIYPTSEATLTLTTCWPIRYVGPAPDRLLLTATPIE